jgi:hypothetical protein
MKYYAAIVSEEEGKAPTVQPPYCMLLSYHYFKKKAELVKSYIAKGYDIFIDSGAFSAETKGVPINIDEYCEFLINTGVGTYAGLDVIGNAKATMGNVRYMEERYKLTPIPTFHLGGDLEDLYKILQDKKPNGTLPRYDYIALGGLVFSSNIMRYCDEVWSIILKEAPGIRVHGFGMTNVELMERYPWYSVDSSSYKGGRRFGRIQILWDGFNFKTFQEDEFVEHLRMLGVPVDTMDNKTRWFLYDFYSVQSYKQYGSHLDDLNKIKDFSYLTAQLKMF